MKPTIGRIVIYNTTEEEQAFMRQGPECNAATQLPAVITAVWGDTCVNLRVIADGGQHMDIWKTSVLLGSGPSTWNWPVIEH